MIKLMDFLGWNHWLSFTIAGILAGLTIWLLYVSLFAPASWLMLLRLMLPGTLSGVLVLWLVIHAPLFRNFGRSLYFPA